MRTGWYVGSKNRNKFVAIAVAGAIACGGIAMFMSVGAVGFFAATEPEKGSIAGPAKLVPDAESSAGGYIQFGIASPPPTTPISAVRGASLYVSPRYADLKRPAALATQSLAYWVGDWMPSPRAEVNGVAAAAARNELSTFVLYNIPKRDCGLYSAGGAVNSVTYRSWVREVAAGIGQRKSIIILEPDALAGMDCMNTADQNARVADLADAVAVFKAQTKAFVYIDAGNSGWHTVDTMADRLNRVNIADSQGFALNVSNFIKTDVTATYGDQLAAKLNGKRYVIDTSRNGKGPAADGQWCNPPGRGLGKKPTTVPTIGNYADAYLWVKSPGESDGDCNGAPRAGEWYEAYAQELIRNAVY